MKHCLVIMAAGMGSRYGGIKQIDPMGPSGEIILDYSVHDALKAGFSRVVFIIRKDIEKAFRDTVGTRFKGVIDVDYVFQELDDLPEGYFLPPGREKPWGTGQAILACRNTVNEPFVVINADDFYGYEAFAHSIAGLESLSRKHLSGFLVAYRLGNTLSPHGYVTRAVCELVGGNISRITERMKIGRNEDGFVEYQDETGRHPIADDVLASMNFWGFSPTLFENLQPRFERFLEENGTKMKTEFLIPTEVDAMIHSNQISIKVLKTKGSWFGVTYPEDKRAVKASLQSLVEQGAYSSPLW